MIPLMKRILAVSGRYKGRIQIAFVFSFLKSLLAKAPIMLAFLALAGFYVGDVYKRQKLFYESKVTEALSLVVEYQKKRPTAPSKLSQSDLERIQTVAAYLSDHYASEIPMERLTQIACMGTTKLKSSFKKVYDCTITEYIQQRRMSQAEYLLTNTDLSIGQIAQTVGYSTSSRFAELFRKSTGLLPGEFRKVGRR